MVSAFFAAVTRGSTNGSARNGGAIKAAVPVDQWIDALGNKKSAFFAAVTGWWAGIDEWFGAKWGAIKAAVPVDQWIDALGNKKSRVFRRRDGLVGGDRRMVRREMGGDRPPSR